MDFEFFLGKADSIGSFFWIPVLVLPAYFFWCRSFDYPSDLEKHIRSGRNWPYLPMYWKGKKKRLIRTTSILLFWLGNLSFACSLYHLFPKPINTILLFVGFCVAIFAEIKIRFYGTNEIIRLQQDRYFQIYTHLANQALAKGDEISDSQLLAKTQWQQQNDLRLADKQGRLLQFLRGEAKL
ncbi:MAG: hypothetical protein LBC75_03185 [Fibromonadaceae bacterium]|nr:hypothetical protein [Fibromonadaceae bacterium]